MSVQLDLCQTWLKTPYIKPLKASRNRTVFANSAIINAWDILMVKKQVILTLTGKPSSDAVELIFSAYCGYLVANMSINASLLLSVS